MTQGWWRPSPGSVYPLLDGMATEGLIKKRDDGRYELTEATRRESEWPFGPGFMNPFGSSFGGSRNIEDILSEINGYISYFEDLSKTSQEKLAPHIEKMRTLTDRLSALTK